jgi:hypothetical protein
MDIMKIENFGKAYPGRSFPAFEHIDTASAAALKSQISGKFQLGPDTDGLSMVRALDSLGQACDEADATAQDFKVRDFLLSRGIAPSEYVYLNWRRFDDIDRLRIKDLDEAFEDIWYPGVDDIEVFDDSLDWMLSIAHHGGLKWARPWSCRSQM